MLSILSISIIIYAIIWIVITVGCRKYEIENQSKYSQIGVFLLFICCSLWPIIILCLVMDWIAKRISKGTWYDS